MASNDPDILHALSALQGDPPGGGVFQKVAAAVLQSRLRRELPVFALTADNTEEEWNKMEGVVFNPNAPE